MKRLLHAVLCTVMLAVGSGSSWAQPEDPCTPPGVTMFTDALGDHDTTNGTVASDILAVSIAEPYFADGIERIVFTMTVQALNPDSLPPNRIWRMYFIDPTDGDSTFYLSLNTCRLDSLLGPAFDFGFRELTPAGSNLDRGLGVAELGEVLPNGQIRVTMPKSKVGSNTAVGNVRWYVPIGANIYAITANTFLLVGANCSGSLQPIDDGSEGSYTAMGNCDLVSVDNEAPAGAFELALAGANPFRGTTDLRYVLPARERVRVELLDVSGRRLSTLSNRYQDAGAHSLPVNLRSARGGRSGAGIYLIRVTAGSRSRTLRLVALE
jgi:hypothetical protein